MGMYKKYNDVGRVLFRVGRKHGQVMISSDNPPEPVETRTIKKIKQVSIVEGEAYFFGVRLNPVVTKNKKRFGLTGEQEIMKWLVEKEELLGVHFLDFAITDEGYAVGVKNGQRISIKIVDFVGRLMVNDEAIFCKILSDGYGHGKGFGCGLFLINHLGLQERFNENQSN
jgi:CRISPR-associated protein Cas6/Cse3/CasE subtype I-E